mgnify:CR=1 FL=1
MNIPKELDMTSWWLRAACKGLLFELLHVTDCYDCPVQQECLWSAIDVDDRLGDEPLLIRGGLSPVNRGAIWFKHKPNKLQVFMYSRMKATEQEAHYHKRMSNRLDNARALAFIRALREVVADNNRPKQVDVVIERSEITEESIKQNVTGAQAARDTMKRRK